MEEVDIFHSITIMNMVCVSNVEVKESLLTTILNEVIIK